MYELIYTSAPKGLIPGRSGFATVAMSEGMPPNLIVPLENLSGYNFTLRDGTFLPILNPPSCYYIKMRYGNQQLHVAGRVAPNGLDYSQRNNKIAHHILFESAEELENISGGVAGLFLKENVFRSEYTEDPMMLPFRKVPVCLQMGSLPARTWAELSGHAGFAAYAAERFRENPDKPLYLIYPPGTSTEQLLNLVMEVCALLNKNLRNYFTFSTYFGSCTASVDCFLRMIPDFSPLASNLRRFHKTDIIELGQENELPFSENYPEIYDCACTGKQPEFFSKASEQSLTQHTIKILADSGLPPIPVKEMFNETPVITVPPPTPAVSYRKFVFAAAAAVIIAAIASLLLYDLPGKTNPKETNTVKTSAEPLPEQQKSGHTEQQPEKPVISESKQTTQPLSLPPVTALKKPSLPEPAKNVKKASQKTPSEPAVKPTSKVPAAQSSLFTSARVRKQAMPLNRKAALSLFITFTNATAAAQGSVRLQLPEQLHGVDEVYPVMQRIGTSNIDNSKFVEKSAIGNEVYIRAAATGSLPLQPIRGEVTEIPHLFISISSDKKALTAAPYTTYQSGCIMPEFKCIDCLYFRVKNKFYVWKNKFDPAYIKLLKPGNIIISGNKQLKYIPGKMQQSLLGFIEIKIGNYPLATFQSSSFYLNDWNQAVIQYTEIAKVAATWQKKVKEMVKTKSAPRTEKEVKEIMKEIQKTAQEGDIELTHNKMISFLNDFFNSEEKSPVTDSDLLEFAEKTSSLLTGQLLNKDLRIKVAGNHKKWKIKIKFLSVFMQNKKNWFADRKKLNAASEKLKIAGNRMLNTARNIHPEIESLLHSMMFTQPEKSWGSAPRQITVAEIKKLSKAISLKVNFKETADSSNTEGE